MKDADFDTVAELIREASETYILPRFRKLQDHEVNTKTNPNDLVTLADIEAEAFFERVLPNVLPGSFVLGEEGVSRGEHDTAVLSADSGQRVWVVDPVDGTYNFVHGRDEFGVMVCLVENGVCTASWIYDVLKNSLASAVMGGGAYVDGMRLQTPATEKSFADMVVHLSAKFFPADLKADIKAKASKMGNVRTVGSAAHEYMKVAKGLSDAAVYCRLKPWDHLPGSLIVREAGGVVAKWNGAAYTPQDRYDGLIVARTQSGWDSVYETFFGDMDIEAYMQARHKRLRDEGKM